MYHCEGLAGVGKGEKKRVRKWPRGGIAKQETLVKLLTPWQHLKSHMRVNIGFLCLRD